LIVALLFLRMLSKEPELLGLAAEEDIGSSIMDAPDTVLDIGGWALGREADDDSVLLEVLEMTGCDNGREVRIGGS